MKASCECRMTKCIVINAGPRGTVLYCINEPKIQRAVNHRPQAIRTRRSSSTIIDYGTFSSTLCTGSHHYQTQSIGESHDAQFSAFQS